MFLSWGTAERWFQRAQFPKGAALTLAALANTSLLGPDNSGNSAPPETTSRQPAAKVHRILVEIDRAKDAKGQVLQVKYSVVIRQLCALL